MNNILLRCPFLLDHYIDTYFHNAGDGNDIILDSDGQGQIRINGSANPLDGGKLKAANLWESADKKTLYTIYTDADGNQTLNILLSGSEKLFVKNWQNNQLGINLQEADAVTPVTPAPMTADHDYLMNIFLSNGEKVFVKDWQDNRIKQVANVGEWRLAA